MSKGVINQIRQWLLDRMVLRPTRHPIDYSPRTRIVFDGPAGPMECFGGLCQEPSRPFGGETIDKPPELLVVKFNGTGGRAENVSTFPANMLDGRLCEIVSWNPPGYGNSAGKTSLRTLSDVALNFFDQVLQAREAYFSGESAPKIWVTGNSLGCITAMRVASERAEVDAVVLRNPPPLVEVVKRVARTYPLGRLTDKIPESLVDEMNLLVTAPLTYCPALVIQSGSDELVPPELQQLVIDAYGGSVELVVLDGLSHNGMPDQQQSAFIAEAVKKLWNQSTESSAKRG